jgi:hypothetical protein
VTTEGPFGFLFQHPRRKYLVTGRLIRLEEKNATFRPDFAHEIVDLGVGEEIPGCSLRLGEALLNLDARVKKNTGQLLLSISPARLEDASLLGEHLTTLPA